MRRLWSILARLPAVAWFCLVFVRELVVANLIVTREVLTPGISLRPAIVAIPTSCTTDAQMMLLANTLTMTPGTLALEVNTETRELYVHGIFVASRESFVADVHRLERTMLRMFR